MAMLDAENLNLRHLFAVAEIARRQSVRKAAQSLTLSQPAVTQALARLEGQLHHRLFDRGVNGVVASPATRLLVERIDRAFAWLIAAERFLGSGAAHWHRRVTSSQLRSLIAIVDSDSISLAARRLGIRQPSVTRTLKDLEDLSGRRLFARAPHGIAVGREAREVARYAGLAFAEIRQGIAAFRESHGQVDGSIVVGSLPLARSAMVPNAVTALLARHPLVRLRIVDGPYPELLHELRTGQLDCIVGALRFPPPADVRQEALFIDRLSIIVRPSHPLLARPSLVPADFAGLEWILPPQATPAHQHFQRFFADLGLAPPSRVIECSSLIAVRGLLLQSDRAAPLSLAQVGFELRSRHLVVLAGPLPATDRPIGLAVRADWTPTAAQSTFLDLLRQAGQAT